MPINDLEKCLYAHYQWLCAVGVGGWVLSVLGSTLCLLQMVVTTVLVKNLSHTFKICYFTTQIALAHSVLDYSAKNTLFPNNFKNNLLGLGERIYDGSYIEVGHRLVNHQSVIGGRDGSANGG